MAVADPTIAAPPVPSAPLPAPPTATTLSGDLADAGGSRRDAVRAHRWTTRGASKVMGDVEVDLAELDGLVSIRGSLKAQSVTARGTLDVGGAVEVAGTLSADGESAFRSGVIVGLLDTHGAVTIGTDLTAVQSVRSHGTMQIGGNVTAPRLEFDGRLEVAGGIVVTELSGRLSGTSHATTLQAERVVIRRAGFRDRRATLEIRTIETKEAELEGVVAEYVRADRIVVGPGCQIARIDGTVTSVHASSHVGPVSRSPAPHGLTR